MVYFVAAFKVGVMFLLSLTSTVLDNTDWSESSKALRRFEWRNTLSNFCRLFELNVDIVVCANARISDCVFSVRVELYFTVVVSSNKSVSGSTITGVTEAIL